MGIQAIQTRYRGYNFRSRLEARWAVAFDAMGLRWEYEPEGFVLPGGTHYLPDFAVYLGGGKGLWVEVKRDGVVSGKLVAFMMALPHGHRGAVLNEIPDPYKVSSVDWDVLFSGEDGGEDCHYQFCVCLQCESVGFEFEGRADRIGCGCERPGCVTPSHKKIKTAYAKARAARFEHEAREVW